MKAIAWQEARMEGSRSLVLAVALSALLLVAILVLGAPAGQKAHAANNTLSAGTVTTQAAADAKSVLLAKDGKFYNCTSKGVKVGSVWSSANRSKVTTLFVASNATKLPANAKFTEGSASGGLAKKGATGSCDLISFKKLKTLSFLTDKSGKNACKTIATRAFYYMGTLTTVNNFNKTKVTSIATQAFYKSGIKSIAFPATVTTVGDSAFSHCESLTRVTGLEKTKIAKLSERAFAYCAALKSISLPASCKTIGDAALAHCSKLTNVKFGSKTASVGSFALAYDSALTKIDLPASVGKLGTAAFYGCSKLGNLTMRSSKVVSASSTDADLLLGNTPVAKSSGGGYIYVPKSVLAKYKAVGKSSGWYDYRSKFKAI